MLAFASAVGMLVLGSTVSWWSTAMPSCVIRRVTSLHCPGCGGTRCAVKLLEGDIAGAASMNLAAVVLAVSGAGVIGISASKEWRGRSAKGVPPWLVWSLAVFVVTFGLLRNLPWWPFTLLAPT